MIEQRTGVIGVSQAEERVDCDNILHQRRSDQSEQQCCVCPRCGYICAGRKTVLCADVQVAYLRSVQLDLVRDQSAL